jgi:hypothetical protein
VRRRSFGKTEIDGEAWLLDKRKSGNVEKSKKKKKVLFLIHY